MPLPEPDGDGSLLELPIVACSLTLRIQVRAMPGPDEDHLFFRVSFCKSTKPVPVSPVARPQP